MTVISQSIKNVKAQSQGADLCYFNKTKPFGLENIH